jgi:prepilin-type N-terminal cleavage/methylation domain-containing protein
MKLFYLYSKKRQGFTLVEMLIVLGLFSFMMTLATGVLYTTQAINVKLQETQSILDNVNVSADIIARDIRYGTDFHCASTLGEAEREKRKSCDYFDAKGGRFLFFKPDDYSNATDRVVYYSSSTPAGNIIFKDEYFGSGGTFSNRYQITANDVKIKSLMYYVVGANSSALTSTDVGDIHDYEQPLITINLSGETIPVMSNASSTKFSIQSTVAARVLDK